MTEKLSVLSIILCDAVIDDRYTGKKTLLGLFSQICAHSVPCIHPKFSVFIAITGVEGTYKGMLRCVLESTGADVMQLDGPVSMAAGESVQELIFELGHIAFPQFGAYRFEFWCDGGLCAVRRFFVIKQTPPSKKRSGHYN